MKEKIEIEMLVVKVRSKKGINLIKLAEMTGISKSMINYIENGKRDPKLSQLVKIAKALDVKVEELYRYK